LSHADAIVEDVHEAAELILEWDATGG